MSNIYEFTNIADRSRDVKQILTADTLQANNLILKNDFEINNLTVNGDLTVSNDAIIEKRMVAEDVECDNITCITHTVDNLFTQNITVDPPETIININSPLEFNNNDISGVGNLTANTIIGNIQGDVIDVNQINSKDNPEIKINDDTVFTTNSVKLTSVTGQESITAPNCLHLQSNGDTCIYLQSDRDPGAGFEQALIKGTTFNGLRGFQLGLGTAGETQFDNGIVGVNGNGDYSFFTSELINNGDAPPTFTNRSLIFRLDNGGVKASRNLVMNGNNITGTGDVQLNSISTTDPEIVINEDVQITGLLRGMTELRISGPITENNGENTLLVHNSATSAVERREVSSLGADLFDQTLNTTDSVSFAGLDMTTNNIVNVGDVELDSITKDGAGSIFVNSPVEFYDGGPTLLQIDNTGIAAGVNLDMGNFPIVGAGDVKTEQISLSGVGPNILINNPIDLQNNNILNVGNITSQFYNTTFVNDKKAIYTKTGLVVSANIDTLLTNWTAVQTSTRVNVDPVTGIFSPVEGLYALTYQALITTTTALNQIGVRLVDDLNTTVYESVVQTFDLFQPETGIEGNQYENLVAFFDGTRSYSLHCKINGTETMDFNVVISRIM